MADSSHPNSEFAHSTTFNPGSAPSGSEMFSGSQHFTVAAQTLSNITNSYTTVSSVPSNFRMISLGDIDLRREIYTVVNRAPQRVRVRRMYYAKVEGRNSRVTVAMYQGNGAEEEWREDVAQYMSARHPNIIQIAGAASSGGIHATLFHDELIPIKEFLRPYQHSHFLEAHVYACCIRDFNAGYCFLFSAFQQAPRALECASWWHNPVKSTHPFEARDSPDVYALSANTAESVKIIIDSFSIGQYHSICSVYLARYLDISISASITVKPGAVVFCLPPSHFLEDSIEIASLSSAAGAHVNWSTHGQTVGEVMKDSWTRLQSGNVLPGGIIGLSWWNDDRHGCWLSQANYIFRRLHITSNFEDYVYFDHIQFSIEFPETTGDVSAGFLFLCPEKDFQTGPLSVRWPDCAAYWSVDPSGVDCLSPEETTQLGFPPFQLTTSIFGRSWDTTVYEGLRQFHQAKGFDPYSQEVARYLGNPLFQLSSEVNLPFAHVDKGDLDTDYKFEAAYIEDPDLKDIVDDDELSYVEDGPTASSGNPLPEPAEILTGEDHLYKSNFKRDAMPTPSGTFKFLMNIQLLLISFLASSWLYDHFDRGK